jgi:tetratricopeptide (TPR) repeat protein
MMQRNRTSAAAEARLADLDYATGNKVGAHEALDRVLAREPNNAPALQMKARWLFLEGKRDQALERAKSAVNADEKSIGAIYLLGMIQAATGHKEEAANSFNQVLRMNPRADAAQVQLSRLLFARGDIRGGMQLAEEALKNAPQSLDARLNHVRGLIAERNGSGADREIAVLIKEYPTSSAVHVLDAAFRLNKKDLAGARKAYDRVVELDPASLDALIGLTAIDILQKKTVTARARVEASLAADPKRPQVLVLAARLHLADRDLAKAEQALRQVLEIESNNTDAYTMLGAVFAAQKKLDSARAEYDELARRNQKNIAARTMSAMIVQAEGQVEDAKKRYAQILEIDPRAAVAANNLASIYADQGENLDLAMQLAQRAVDLLPDRAEVRDTIGWIYYRKQVPILAVRPFEEATAMDPNNPTYRYHLGLAYAKTGDSTRARQALQGALQLNPKLLEARRELNMLPLAP